MGVAVGSQRRMLGIRRRIKQALRGSAPKSVSAPLRPIPPRAPVVVKPPVTIANVAPQPPAPSGNVGAVAPEAIVGSLRQQEPVVAKVEPETSVDDSLFWGPVDNESARERAAGKTLDIDQEECIGCGTCVENTERVFYLDDDECKAYVIAQEGDMERVQDAIDACPVTCISWL